MRCLVGLSVVLAVVVTLPPIASAQDAKEGPALQLELDEGGVGVVPDPALTLDGYTRAEMERRAKRAKIGLGVSAFTVVTGIAFTAAAARHTDAFSFCFFGECDDPPQPGWVAPLGWTGVALMGTGVAGLLASGILLGVRRRKVPGWPQERVRRIQWDVARSRLAF